MFKKYILFVFAVVVIFVSCDKRTFDPVLNVGNGPALTAPSANASFVLTEDNASNVMTTFNWSTADFGFQAGVTYDVEMDVAGNNFADSKKLGSVNGTSLDVIVGKMNDLLLAAGLPDNVAANIEVRVAAIVSADVDPLYSDPLTIAVTPYLALIDYPKLYVPGNYQGWDPANVETVIHSINSDDKYEGYIYFGDGSPQYKFTPAPNWDNDYGDTGGDGTLEEKGDNITLPEAGYYRINADLIALTHAATKTEWGLIGDATPDAWDSDQDMTLDTETGIWSITLDLTDGEIKFRANDAWDIDFGDNDTNKSLEYGGANIPVTAGNYTIELILNQANYTYTLTKN